MSHSPSTKVFDRIRVPSDEIVGSTTPLTIATDSEVQPFVSSNAPGDLRSVDGNDDVRKLGASAAEMLVAEFSDNS